MDLGAGVVLPSVNEVGRDLKSIVVHHTESSPNTSVADVDRWHKSKGWDGIGYHFLIGSDGTINVGRPLAKQGAHAYQHNETTIGIALAGSFERHDLPSKQAQGLIRLAGALSTQYGIDPLEHMVGHIHLNQTACPGAHVLALMPKLRSETKAQREAIVAAFLNNNVGVGPTRAAEAVLTMRMVQSDKSRPNSKTEFDKIVDLVSRLKLKPRPMGAPSAMAAPAATKQSQVNVKVMLQGAEPVHGKQVDHNHGKKLPMNEISLQQNGGTMVAQAAYPDGSPWMSLFDPYMAPVEEALIDPYAG